MALIFQIREEEESGYHTRAFGAIFSQLDSLDDLRPNLLATVSLHFEDAATRPQPMGSYR